MATFDTLAPQVINRLSSDLGLTQQQAVGIVGQLAHESDGLQAINEYKPVVPGSRGGFGWAQWTGPRRRDFESWAEQNKMDVSTPDANYGFLLHELQNTPEGRVLDSIRGAEDAQTAGRIFTDKFLRPGTPLHDQRASWTDRAMNLLMPTAHAGTLPQGGMQAKIQAARDAGYSDDEIMGHVSQMPDFSTKLQQARDAGYSDDEVFGHLGLSMGATQQAPIDPPSESYTSPDGIIDVNLNYPTDAQQPQPQPDQERSFLGDVGRQVGLTTRHGMEGIGQAAGMLAEPLRQGLNVGLRATGLPEAAPFAQSMSYGAGALGLPTPENATERVAGDVTQLLSAGGGVMGGAGALARGATGLTQSALQALSMNPGQQLASALGAGGAGGVTRESGGGPVAQGVAALAGGLAAPMALSGAQSIGRGIQGRIESIRPQKVLTRLQEALNKVGVDIDSLPGRVRQQLQDEASVALRSGRDLDPMALRRLADFAQVEGATPTRGMLTQNPGQVTREQNLAKLQANTSAIGGPNLSQVQNDNNAALVRALDNMGAGGADDAIDASGQIMMRLRDVDAPRKAAVDQAYQAVRDSSGRYEMLSPKAFSEMANNALDEKQLGYSLPSEVRNLLNDISGGKIPFNVNTATQLDSTLSGIAAGQRSGASPNLRAALATDEVRRALHAVPLESTASQESIALYNQARQLAADRFSIIERTPGLKAALDNKSPDKFVNEFLLGSSDKKATTAHVQALAEQLSDSPASMAAARGQITSFLKDKALSGVPDDIGAAKFSPTQYAKALKSMGDKKLGAFFDADEIEQLHAIGRAGRLMVNQPVGSAVNNSNTSAALLGRALESMGALGKGVKILGIGDQIGAFQSALGQRAAKQIAPALTTPGQTMPFGQRLIPASVYGGLLAAPGVERSENNNRR